MPVEVTDGTGIFPRIVRATFSLQEIREAMAVYHAALRPQWADRFPDDPHDYGPPVFNEMSWSSAGQDPGRHP